jgi:hypothetical protein
MNCDLAVPRRKFTRISIIYSKLFGYFFLFLIMITVPILTKFAYFQNV